MITGLPLSDRYHVGDVIGQGGMSVVLRGQDVRLGRDVAIKVLRSDLADDARFQARFRREATNAASLNHPAIVGVYDTGETDSEHGTVPYIVMEYVDGPTLADVLAENGRLPIRRSLEIAADVAAALDFSHRHGVVHRDLSPKNILLDGTGAVKVTDFGVTSAMTNGAGRPVGLAAIGTAKYLSPEQARGEPVDARSDVYGAGCVLYEMLTGQTPFTADSAVAIAQQHVRQSPRPPSELSPGLPADVDAIVLTALSKNPLDRYQSAAALRTAIACALSGRTRTAVSGRTRTAVTGAVPGVAGASSAATSAGSPPLLAPPTALTSPDDSDFDRDRNHRRTWGFAGIGVLCLVVLAGAVWLTLQVINAGPPPAPVAVPDLSGISVAEATAILQAKNLTLGTITEVDSDDALRGAVVHQRPSSLTQVDRNTAVNVEVGRGITTVAVPDVLGVSAAVAEQAIVAAHLRYAEQNQPSSDADKGKILAQSADPLSAVAPNSIVTVTVGTGLTLVTVPDGLLGQSIDQATKILRDAHLTVVSQDTDGTEPVNQVIRVDQPAGRRLPEDTPVTVAYSNNTLMLMPPLQAQSPEQAVSVLQNLGWGGDLGSLSISGQATANAALIGVVLRQDPAAGTVVRKIGTPVRVGVGVRQVVVPNVVGGSQSQAESMLRQAGATNITFSDAGAAPRGQAGRVKSQSAPANSTMASDAPIVIGVYGN